MLFSLYKEKSVKVKMSSYNNIKNQNTITKNVYDILHSASTEATQKEVLNAIKNINIQVQGGTFNANDITTHDKLDIINTTLENGLDVNILNSSIPVSGTVSISNDIIIVDPINNSINESPFDLMINGPTLWADSTPTPTPFFADLNGREGWYYDNFSNIANKSNIYWYANPVSGNLQENDMTFAQLSSMYCIITPDYVENGELTIPFMGLYSQPTGTNDFIPTFAHSRWVYQLNAINRAKLRKGETIILYTGTTRPQVHLNTPAYPLVLASQNGDALSSEIIAYMTVNTQATTSKIGYLLQIVGYLNSAIGFNREYQFRNSKDRVIQNNQYSGSISVSNFPANQTISGSVSITGTPSVNANISNSSIAVTGAFYPETQPISGSVGITGTPSVNANISNSSIAVTGAFYPETQPISGSVGITGTPSVNANISNSSIDVHCYASSNGTNWHHLKSDANGVLNTHSMMQDGSGLDIGSKQYPMGTGTSNALSVNLAAQEQNVDVNISNPVSITGYTFTTLNNGTQLGTTNSSLNTSSVMYSLGETTGGGVALSILESTSQGNRNNLLVYDNTTSTLVTLSNTYLNTINSSITGLNQSVNTGNAGITSLIISGNTTLNNINQSITSGNAGITALLTTETTNTTNINNKLVQQYSTQNNTIGGYGLTGMNVYQILPKTKSFAMAGTNPNGSVADTLLGGAGTTLRVDTTSFGYANQKTFYGYIPSGSGTLRTIAYTFINSSGVESSTSTAITAFNTYTPLFTGSGINELKFNGVNPGANDLVYITINNSAIVNNVASLNIRNHYNGVFTCPSNAIGQVISIDYNLSTGGEQLFMNIYDSSGARSSIYAGFFYQTGVNNFRASPDGIGRIIQPLESVCFSTSSTTPTSKYLYYTVLVKYF